MASLAAQALGFYAEEGLHVEEDLVFSSTQQFESLRDGEYDLVSTSPDNVANYALNAANPLGAPVPAVTVMGTAYQGELRLVARPELRSVGALRGKRLAVDAAASVADPYLGGVVAARPEWLEANEDVAIRFIRASRRAARWVLDRGNRDEVVALLMALPGTDRALAERLYASQTDPATGLIAGPERTRRL